MKWRDLGAVVMSAAVVASVLACAVQPPTPVTELDDSQRAQICAGAPLEAMECEDSSINYNGWESEQECVDYLVSLKDSGCAEVTDRDFENVHDNPCGPASAVLANKILQCAFGGTTNSSSNNMSTEEDTVGPPPG